MGKKPRQKNGFIFMKIKAVTGRVVKVSVSLFRQMERRVELRLSKERKRGLAEGSVEVFSENYSEAVNVRWCWCSRLNRTRAGLAEKERRGGTEDLGLPGSVR